MNIVNSRYGHIAISDNTDLISKSLNIYGEWAQNEIWIFERLIKPGNIVLDIGSYIGTHTLAFSEFVGPNGFVHSFDPQPHAQLSLELSIKENCLSNVKLHPYALGEDDEVIGFKSSRTDQFNLGSFSIKRNLSNVEEEKFISIKTLDSLPIEKIDFIKIDVEGMEVSVLKGGELSISKNRPTIVCECNFLENGAPLISWAAKNNFVVYGVEIAAFNSQNYANNKTNIFGNAGEVALILIPQEKECAIKPLLSSVEVMEINTIDELALLMLRKPQYLAEVKDLRGITNRKAVEDSRRDEIEYYSPATTERSSDSLIMFPRRFNIVVPFYKNPQLVRPLFNSLIDCSNELFKLNAKIYFYNDSPDDIELKNELSRCLRDTRLLKLEIIENQDNLGFVETVNKAFKYSVESREDIILLNSDTIVFPGVFLELAEIAYSDHMIGFVSPRSNNATICTFPHGADLLNIPPFECFSRFKSASQNLPRLTYVPTAVGFCMYIKWSILVELGGFDLVYGRGYNEENDLIMRANRLGYRAALANRAFVWHQGEQSFGSLEQKKNEREELNSKLLCARYPEYPALIQEYFESPEYRAEKLISELSPKSGGVLKIGFDLSNFGAYHNGTFEAGKNILFAAADIWPNDVELTVFISKSAWEFHGLGKCTRLKWIDVNQSDEKAAAIVRMGQPFDPESILRIIHRAPVVSAFMLDTISYDCGYLKVEFDTNLWHFAMRWFDVIFTNSKFTAEQFSKRFQIGLNTKLYPSLHSVTPNEYNIVSNTIGAAVAKDSQKLNSIETSTILVIGNKFEHKALRPTIEHLSTALPDFNFIALGCSGLDQKNVTFINSGALSDNELDDLYSKVDAIVFPSHYEGFGFPVMHAIARQKRIFARRMPVLEEVGKEFVSGQENIIWFESKYDLIEKLNNESFSWVGPAARGEANGWKRSALEVLEVLQASMKSVTTLTVADRLRWGELSLNVHALDNYSSTDIDRATRFASRKMEKYVRAVLKVPFLYKSFRGAYKLSRKILG